MKIDIADAIKNEGEVYTQGYDGGLADIEFMGEVFKFPKVRVKAEYSFNGEGVQVDGSFTANTEVVCSRCLKAFEHTVDFRFSEYFAEDPQEDEGIYPYTGEVIDLSTMLEDNIVMSLPMRFLCKDDCKGLCPVCGRDLNEGECGCVPDEGDNPFKALSALKDNEEE